MGKALNDSDLFTSADVLDEKVKKVNEEITQVQSACSDNLSTLCIMEKLCAEALRKITKPECQSDARHLVCDSINPKGEDFNELASLNLLCIFSLFCSSSVQFR